MSKQLDDETNLKAAIQLLISHFVQLNDSATKLKIKLDIDSTIVVDNDQIVTISIIINELLQNVVSHAFPNGIQKDSQVSIIGQAENGIITIRVQDNGVGFDLDQTRSGSLGLMIIRSYVSDKLLGRLKIKSSSRGTVTSFSFDQQTQH
jgi:two-component sensor histidine kinase